MDLQAQHRHHQPEASRRVTTRERAADARLRRAIREAFARQRAQSAEPPAKPQLYAVPDPPPRRTR
jgi:hypothetical protein